ncbi:hypothetical protein H311_00660, partial [Anncaliia algerae PRA109]
NLRKIYSLLKGTIFENKSMPFSDILFLSYLWVSNITHTSVKNITSFSENTIVKINRKIKERIAHSIKPESLRIGGPGIFVELDESKFGKRKYNRGHRVEGAWVFAGVEKTEERKCFAFVVEKRDMVTLTRMIETYVMPGSIIITDGWKGYNLIKNHPNFTHHWVNHSISFRNNEGYNTNTIEGTFNGMKMNISARNRTKKFLKDKLFEFIWRRQNKNNLWQALLNILF